MNKIGTGVVETGRGDQRLAPWWLPITRWLASGLQGILTAPLSIIWKPQICRINSKFFDCVIANLSYFLCCQSPCSKWVHPPRKEFSQLLQCASFSDPPFYTMFPLPEWASSLCVLGDSHPLFKTWLRWTLFRYLPNTSAVLFGHPFYISLLEQSSVQYYTLRFL